MACVNQRLAHRIATAMKDRSCWDLGVKASKEYEED